MPISKCHSRALAADSTSSSTGHHPWPSPLHANSFLAPEANWSEKVSKFGAILHASGLIFFPSILSLSLLLFHSLRAGKTPPACLQGRNVSPDIVSSAHKTLGCFVAAAERAADNWHVSSQKLLKGGGWNSGQGQRPFRLGHVALGHSLHPGLRLKEHNYLTEPSEALAEM